MRAVLDRYGIHGVPLKMHTVPAGPGQAALVGVGGARPVGVGRAEAWRAPDFGAPVGPGLSFGKPHVARLLAAHFDGYRPRTLQH